METGHVCQGRYKSCMHKTTIYDYCTCPACVTNEPVGCHDLAHTCVAQFQKSCALGWGLRGHYIALLVLVTVTGTIMLQASFMARLSYSISQSTEGLMLTANSPWRRHKALRRSCSYRTCLPAQRYRLTRSLRSPTPVNPAVELTLIRRTSVDKVRLVGVYTYYFECIIYKQVH